MIKVIQIDKNFKENLEPLLSAMNECSAIYIKSDTDKKLKSIQSEVSRYIISKELIRKFNTSYIEKFKVIKVWRGKDRKTIT